MASLAAKTIKSVRVKGLAPRRTVDLMVGNTSLSNRPLQMLG
jgi:hypothetical protein